MDLSRAEQFFRSRQPHLMDTARDCAILVPLVRGEGGLSLLYEVRSHTMRRQPGEICFPGGRMEGAESPEECALRETWEELAIPAGAVQVLGPLDFIAHRAGRAVYPILGLVEEEALEHMSLNPGEVAETFLVPLARLWEQAPKEYSYPLVPQPGEDFPYEEIGIPRDYAWVRGRETVPVYFWEGRVIWGLTGRITRNLIRLLRELEQKQEKD